MKRTNTAQWIESRQRWQINVQKDGIRKTFTSSKPGRTGQREANAKADRWLDEGVENTKIKVSQAAEQYMEHLKLSTSKTHWRQYEGYFRNWINPNIGSVRIENLTEQKLQSIIDKAYSQDLSRKTLNNIKCCLTAFIKFCRSCNYTSLFPEGLTIPREAKTKEKQILQPSHLRTLFSEDSTLYRNKETPDPLIYAYRFHVLTGIRPGELSGLKWSEVFDGVVHLQRSINSIGNTTTGKNENARRNFGLNIFTNTILEEQRKLLKERGIESEYVFPDEYGNPIKSPHYYKRWVIYRDYHAMNKVTPYELRHTFVSCVKTLPDGYLKQLVGHSKDMDTLGVYGHTMDGDMANTASMVQEIFKSILVG